jgi:hypothetical protein
MYCYFVLKWEDSKINHKEIGCKSTNWVCSFTLEQAMKVQKGRRYIALCFL